MKHAFICLFVVLSLLLAPVAHAACIDGDCPATEQSAEKQDDGKLIDSHHCCHVAVDRSSLKIATPLHIGTATTIIAEQTNLTSFIVGPLLEPPSFA